MEGKKRDRFAEKHQLWSINSPYSLPHISFDFSGENLGVHQDNIHSQSQFFFNPTFRCNCTTKRSVFHHKTSVTLKAVTHLYLMQSKVYIETLKT